MKTFCFGFGFVLAAASPKERYCKQHVCVVCPYQASAACLRLGGLELLAAWVARPRRHSHEQTKSGLLGKVVLQPLEANLVRETEQKKCPAPVTTPTVSAARWPAARPACRARACSGSCRCSGAWASKIGEVAGGGRAAHPGKAPALSESSASTAGALRPAGGTTSSTKVPRRNNGQPRPPCAAPCQRGGHAIREREGADRPGTRVEKHGRKMRFKPCSDASAASCDHAF